MTRVGLIGPPEREEIERLAIRLEERGAEGVVFDARPDPEIVVGPGRLEACGKSLAGISRLDSRAALGADPARSPGERAGER